MSPKLAREQYWTIIALCILALIFATLWLIDEVRGCLFFGFQLEPLVVAFASAVPILTLFWPFNPKYRSKRITDTIIIEGAHRKVAEMGAEEYFFSVRMSSASNTSVHIYTSDPVMEGAFIADENRFEDVNNAGAYTLSSESQMANRGDIIVLKNRYDNYCLMTFTHIEAKKWDGATRDVWTIRYVINPTGGANFR